MGRRRIHSKLIFLAGPGPATKRAPEPRPDSRPINPAGKRLIRPTMGQSRVEGSEPSDGKAEGVAFDTPSGETVFWTGSLS